MAIIPIPRNYPRPMAWNDRARNGKVPDWRLVATAVDRHLFALTNCRKVVFHKATNPGNAPQGSASSIVPWRWQCRTGESNDSGNTIILHAEAEVLPADNTAASDPRWRFTAGANNSAYRRFPAAITAPTYDDVKTQRVQITGLIPNTEYQCSLEIEDYGRVLSLTVWEAVPIEANSAATYVSGTYQTVGNTLEITDAQHAEFAVTDPFTIWKHNGAHIANLVPDDSANPWATTSATYVNLLDAAASTTVGANTPGINAVVQYHSPAHTNSLSAVFAVYAKATGATGGDVILKDSGGVLGTISNFNTTGEWKSVAVSLDGSLDRHKVDVQFQISGASSTQLDVHAVSLYEYEA